MSDLYSHNYNQALWRLTVNTVDNFMVIANSGKVSGNRALCVRVPGSNCDRK